MFLVFLSELNLIYMGIYVELASIFQVDFIDKDVAKEACQRVHDPAVQY